MRTKKFWWVLGCFDFEIKFRAGRQTTEPNELSQKSELSQSKDYMLTSGKLLKPGRITSELFAEVLEFEDF